MKLPKWLNKIPQGTHGSGIAQKKLWRVCSDYVRIKDFYQFGTCISCGKRFTHWRDGQCCHFRAYSVCRGYSKWETNNLFLGCSACNTAYDSNLVGKRFAEGIVERYGKQRLEQLENMTNRPIEKLEDSVIVEMTKDLIILMADLPEQPDYWKQAYDLITQED